MIQPRSHRNHGPEWSAAVLGAAGAASVGGSSSSLCRTPRTELTSANPQAHQTPPSRVVTSVQSPLASTLLPTPAVWRPPDPASRTVETNAGSRILGPLPSILACRRPNLSVVVWPVQQATSLQLQGGQTEHPMTNLRLWP
eukprot:CAMPEP_0171097918 /NCGR_PEP_ID=MMETSP0766_2-20121228/47826_1 /TAXON_ID=439317 /ORGANISM="Gambierdiscus australes, Strain CAWD 149" /LENGTH=140 /DNA_ID=CAMNT_0011557191 /DNA_START=224 /DNA_END=646 /DNA_ORIENTATION=-